MNFFKKIKEDYNKKFDSSKKKAGLKLLLGTIFFILACISLLYGRNLDDEETNSNDYYTSTLKLLEDKKDVYSSIKTYIGEYNYEYSYSNIDNLDECEGKFFNIDLYYIECVDETGYYKQGDNIEYYDVKTKKLIETFDIVTIPEEYFFDISVIKSANYNKIGTNFDGSKTYNYLIDNKNIDITFYNQDLLKIKYNNVEYYYKNSGKIIEKDIIKNFE